MIKTFENFTNSAEDLIKQLKVAKKAYQIALEYDYAPSDSDHEAYDEEVEMAGLSGCRPDEIAGSIMRLIDQL